MRRRFAFVPPKRDLNKEENILEVRQNNTDSTALIYYSRGVSPVHFSLFLAWFYVIWPDDELSQEFRQMQVDPDRYRNCYNFAWEVKANLICYLAIHVLCGLQCFWAEIRPMSKWAFKIFMDTFCVVLNFGININGMTVVLRYYGYEREGTEECYKLTNHERWLGGTIAWFIIEVMVFIVFLFTLFLVLVKTLLNYSVIADDRE